MTQTEARELAQRFGVRMCDENGNTHGEELYCFGLDDIIAIKEALEQEKALQALHDENERLRLYKDAYAQPEQREPTKQEHNILMGALKRSGKVVAQPEQEPTYTSTQATNCAGCGEHKHTPLRIDAMGGYVCLTCIDKQLGTMLGEFGYAQPEQEPVAWIYKSEPFFDGDKWHNTFEVTTSKQVALWKDKTAKPLYTKEQL